MVEIKFTPENVTPAEEIGIELNISATDVIYEITSNGEITVRVKGKDSFSTTEISKIRVLLDRIRGRVHSVVKNVRT